MNKRSAPESTRVRQKWSLSRTLQCAKCPWLKDSNPLNIPNGYSVKKHRALKSTIAGECSLALLNGPRRVMACHEEHEAHCIGWIANQIGPGNNIALRIHMMSCENYQAIKLLGEQHERFQDTLPYVQKT